MAPKKGSRNPGKAPSEHSDGWFPCPHCRSAVSNRRTINVHFRTWHADKFSPLCKDHVCTRHMQNAGIALEVQREHVRRAHERLQAEYASDVKAEGSGAGLDEHDGDDDENSDLMPPTMGPSQPQQPARGTYSGSFAPTPYKPPHPNQYSGGFTGRLLENRRQTRSFTSRQQSGGEASLAGGHDNSQQVGESSLPQQVDVPALATPAQEPMFPSPPVRSETPRATQMTSQQTHQEHGLESNSSPAPRSELRRNAPFGSSSQPAVPRRQHPAGDHIHPDAVALVDGDMNTPWGIIQGRDGLFYHDYPPGYDLAQESAQSGGSGVAAPPEDAVADVQGQDEAVAPAYVPDYKKKLIVKIPYWKGETRYGRKGRK